MLIDAIDALSGDLHRYFLKSVNRRNELIIWEKIFIHKHAHHIMNFEVPPESFIIKKYVCRPPDSALMPLNSIATTYDTTLQSI
jgi:hypothetical protein